MSSHIALGGLPSSHLKGDLGGLDQASQDDQPFSVHSHPNIVGPAHSVHQPTVHMQLQPLHGDAKSNLVPAPIAEKGNWEPVCTRGARKRHNMKLPHLMQDKASTLLVPRVPHAAILRADAQDSAGEIKPSLLSQISTVTSSQECCFYPWMWARLQPVESFCPLLCFPALHHSDRVELGSDYQCSHTTTSEGLSPRWGDMTFIQLRWGQSP